MENEIVTPLKKVRYNWLDEIKAVAIIYVIFGHLAANGMELFAIYSSVVKLPLFFAASGFVFSLKKLKNPLVYVKNRAFRLILSYVLLTFFSTILSKLCNTSGEKNDFIEIIKSCITNTIHLKMLWFLPVLFVVDLLFYIIMKLTNCNYKIIGIVAVVCVAFGYITSKFGNEIKFYISAVIISFPCFIFGFFYKKFMLNTDKKIKIIIGAVCLSVYVFLPLYFYLQDGTMHYINIHDNIYTNYIINQIQMFTGLVSYFVFFEIIKIPEFIAKPVLYIGKNTLYFYAYHLVIFDYLMLLIRKISGFNLTVGMLKIDIPGRLIYGGITVLGIMLLFPLCMFNNKCFPVTVGKKMRETNCIFLKLKRNKKSEID